MSGEEFPRTGAMRFTGTGDVEVFDGRSWRPLASIMGDSGMREDPAQHVDADGYVDGYVDVDVDARELAREPGRAEDGDSDSAGLERNPR